MHGTINNPYRVVGEQSWDIYDIGSFWIVFLISLISYIGLEVVISMVKKRSKASHCPDTLSEC